MEDSTVVNLVILILVSVLMWAGHYTPWWRVPGIHDKDGKLDRIPSYIGGVLCILIGFAIYARLNLTHTVMQALLFLVLDVLFAGITTMLLYVFDALNKGKEEERRRHELEKMQGTPTETL